MQGVGFRGNIFLTVRLLVLPDRYWRLRLKDTIGFHK